MFIIRFLTKIFAWPYFLIRYRVRKYYTNKFNKTKFSGGVIFVSNYQDKSNSFIYSFIFFFKKLYFWCTQDMNKGYLRIANKIYVDDNKTHIKKSKSLLKKNKKVFIYTDFEINKEGKIKSINPDIITLAKESNAQIIPIYVNKIKKRIRINIGNRINQDNLENINQIKPEFNFLKKQMNSYIKFHTHNLFDFYWGLFDYSRIASWFIIPKLPIFFPIKYHYMEGANRKTRRFKGKGIIMSNHKSFVDPMMLFMSFWTRRVSIVASEDLLENTHFLKFVIKHTHMLIAHKTTNQNGDTELVNDAVNLLNANGVVGIFPEGHIYHEDSIQSFNGGVVLIALLSNSPIYPIYFSKEFKPFKMQHAIVGKPIHLADYYEKGATINTELINKLTIIVQNEMSKLEQKSKEFIKK